MGEAAVRRVRFGRCRGGCPSSGSTISELARAEIGSSCGSRRGKDDMEAAGRDAVNAVAKTHAYVTTPKRMSRRHATLAQSLLEIGRAERRVAGFVDHDVIGGMGGAGDDRSAPRAGPKSLPCGDSFAAA